MDELISAGDLISPEDVRSELRNPAELAKWAKKHDQMFIELDDAVQESLREVLADAQRTLEQQGLQFLPKDLKADPIVVALAKIDKRVVVSHETPLRGDRGRPKIPDLCKRHGLQHIGLAELIEAKGWKF